MQARNETGAGKAGAGGTPRAKGAARRREGLRAGTSPGESCTRAPPEPPVPIARGPPGRAPSPGERGGCPPTYPTRRRRGRRGPGRSANSPPSSARPAWWGAGPGEGAAPPACQHSPDTARSVRPPAPPLLAGASPPRPPARSRGTPLPSSLPTAEWQKPPLDPSLRLRSRCPGAGLPRPTSPEAPTWRAAGSGAPGSSGTGGCGAAVGGVRPLTWAGPGGALLQGTGGRGVRSHRSGGVLRRLLPALADLPRSCPGCRASRRALDG